MRHALALAARGLGTTWPNPSVGCVIVRDGMVVGRGWTQPGGRPHAEVMALTQAGELARGATAYVTLEPCAHFGKSPPCANALVKAQVARVVSATTDPDPRVAGKGHRILRQANIDVMENLCHPQAWDANRGFFKRVMQGLPLVTLKLATTLDGRIATASGESRWITGPLARRQVHLMRLTHDAVMVGSGTAAADDPDLTVREFGTTHQPVRVVLDRTLRTDPKSRLGSTARQVPVWIIHGETADPARVSMWAATGAKLFACPGDQNGLDLTAAMRILAEQGLTRIFSEGGGKIGAALIKYGLVDDLVQFAAGKVMGAEGAPSVGPLDVGALADAPQFQIVETRVIGPDVMTRWSRGPASIPSPNRQQ